MLKCKCRKAAMWTWRENDEETPLCAECFLAALQLLVESRDGSVEWVTPRTQETGAHKGSELLGMLTVQP